MLYNSVCFCRCQTLFRRALEDDKDALKTVREARVISPGVLANSAPREASESRYEEGGGAGRVGRDEIHTAGRGLSHSTPSSLASLETQPK